MSFINFRNFEAPKQRKISKTELLEALLKYETKNKKKAESLLESFGEEIEFADAINAFSNKTVGITALSIVEAKPGPDPYMTGLDDETEEDKEEQMKKQAEMDDDDPEAYKEMPGDEEAREKGKVKTSKHTKAYDELYGDDEETDEAQITISKEDMEKLHKDGSVEIDGHKVTFEAEVKGEEVALPAEEIEAEDKKVNTEADKKTTDTSAELEADLEGTADGAGKEVVESSLNEGQFSWMTHDTGEQIGSESENTITVYMYDNEGNRWEEKRYEGYGIFGGMDYYSLLDKMNGGEGDRDAGIKLAFDEKKVKAGKVLFPALVTDPRYNWKRHNFKIEADNDPNQSWYQEEEYDEYYDSAKPTLSWDSLIEKINEMDINEWGSSDQSAMNKTIHRDAGKPKTMPSPFDKKLRRAAEDAVDFYWDDWAEYETDRDGLIDNAVRGYLRSYFPKDWATMVRMFEPMESAVTEAGINDPVLMAFRAAKMKREKELAKPKRRPLYGKQREKAEEALWVISQDLKDLYADRGQLLIDMEQEAEVEGGPVADRYGEQLDMIEDKIASLIKQRNKLEMKLAEAFVSEETEEVIESSEVEEIVEAKFVKDFDKAILDATTKDDVLKVYPNAEFFVGKTTHFFGELEPNLFFKAYYTKGKDFEIASIYSEKGSRYVHLWKNEAYESEELHEANWGTYSTPEGKQADKKLDKAFAKFKAAVSKAHATYRDEIKGLSGSDLGNKSGFNDSEGGMAVAGYLQHFVKSEFMMSDMGDISRFDYMNGIYEGKIIEEGRSIGKIQKEWGNVTAIMKDTVAKYKTAEGQEKEDLLDELKSLTSAKKKLEAELDAAVGIKDMDAELAEAEDYSDKMSFGQLENCIDYSTMIRERIEQGTELDPWMHSQIAIAKQELASVWEAVDGDDGVVESLDAKGLSQKILGQLDTFGQLHIDYVAPEVLTTIEDVLSKYRSLRGGKLTQKIATEVRNALEDTGNLAGDAYRHIKDIDYIIADALSESKLNEDLRSDLKKYIKKNKKELDQLADEDNWDGIYQMLINDFSVDSDSEEAEELKTIFNIVY